MFLIANTFAICFNKDYLLTYLLIFAGRQGREIKGREQYVFYSINSS